MALNVVWYAFHCACVIHVKSSAQFDGGSIKTLTFHPIIDEHVFHSNALAVGVLKSVDDFSERQCLLTATNVSSCWQSEHLQELVHLYTICESVDTHQLCLKFVINTHTHTHAPCPYPVHCSLSALEEWRNPS